MKRLKNKVAAVYGNGNVGGTGVFLTGRILIQGMLTSILVICFVSAFAQGQPKKQEMTTSDFTTTLLVDQTPEEVFKAITNVRGWWSEEIEGSTVKLNDEFMYRYKDVHRGRIKLVEVIPGQKVVWLVMDNYFKFTKDSSEWTGTKMIFEISKKDSQTQLRFTHLGLVPDYECYNICEAGWNNYINNSLSGLIMTGKGKPNPKEGGFNERLTEKWKLNKQ